MKSIFLNFILAFHHFAAKNKRNKVFVFFLVLLLWLLAISSFSKIELSSSSADLLPDSSIKLQKMARGMDLAPFSRLFFIDIYEKTGNAEILEESARIIEKALPEELAFALHRQKDIKAEDFMLYLPNLFTEKVKIEAEKKISKENLTNSLESALSLLSTFAPAKVAEWLAIDPLNFKDFIFKALPNSISNYSSVSSSEFTYSADKKHILLTYQPLISMHDTKAAEALLQRIRNAASLLPASVELNFNGGIVHTAVNTQVIENDIKNIAFFSLFGLILLYFCLIRSFSGIWLLLTPALAISLSLGVMTSVSVLISGLALGFGSAVLGIAEDYAVHIHCALDKSKAKTKEEYNIYIDKIFNLLTIPLFQGYLLNISGFFVLTFSSLPAIRQLAYFAILSLTFGFLIALFILPLCPRFKIFNFIKKKVITKEEVSKEISLLTPKLSSTLIVTSTLLLLSFLLFTQTKIDVSPQSMGVNLDFADTNSEKFAKTWASSINEKNTRLFILEDEDEENLFYKSRLIVDKLTHLLSQNQRNELGEITTIDTLAYFLPTQEEQNENIARFVDFAQENYTYLLENIEIKSQEFNIPPIFFKSFLALLEKTKEDIQIINTENLSQSTFSHLLDFFVLKPKNKQDNKFYTLIIYKNENSANSAYTQIDKILAEDLLFADLVELSPEALEEEILVSFYKEAAYLPLALLLCTCILYLYSFNLAKCLLSLTPALFSLFSVLLGMYLLQSPLTLGALTALLIVLGLALDHGIFVSNDLEHNVDFDLKRALLISSLSTILGMGLLAFASHPTLRDMGRIIVFGLILEVPVSLYLLPLLCKKQKEN